MQKTLLSAIILTNIYNLFNQEYLLINPENVLNLKKDKIFCGIIPKNIKNTLLTNCNENGRSIFVLVISSYIFLFLISILSIIFLNYCTTILNNSIDKNIKIRYFRYNIYLLLIQFIIPVIFSTINYQLKKSLHVLYYDKSMEYFSEYNDDLNTINIFYSKEINNWDIVSFLYWFIGASLLAFEVILIYKISKLNNLSNTPNSEKLLTELIMIAPFTIGFLYGSYNQYFIIDKNFYINGIFNLVYFYVVWSNSDKNIKWEKKKLICVFYLFFSFNIILKMNQLELYLKLTNNINSEIVRFVYTTLLFGFLFQNIMSIILFLKKNTIGVINSICIEWMYIILINWVNIHYENINIHENFIISILFLLSLFSCMSLVLFFVQFLIYSNNKNFNIFSLKSLIIFILIDDIQIFQKNIYYFTFYFLYQIFLFSSLKFKKIIHVTKLVKCDKLFDCLICYDSVNKLQIFEPCGHWICNNCYEKKDWIFCPMCRKDIDKFRLYEGEKCPIHEHKNIKSLKKIFVCEECYKGKEKLLEIYF